MKAGAGVGLGGRISASGCCFAVDEQWYEDALLGCPLRLCRVKMMLIVTE